MSNYEKKIKMMMDYLKESDEKIYELQVECEKEKDKCVVLNKQLKEYDLQINKLKDTLINKEEILCNLQLEYDKEKCSSRNLNKQVKEYTSEIKIVNNKLNLNEENFYNLTIRYEELLKKYDENKIQNKELQRILKIKEDKEIENKLYISNIEKEIVNLNDKMNISKDINTEINNSTDHIIIIEPVNTLSLHDELELLKIKNDSNKIKDEKIKDLINFDSYNEKLKKINIYIWIYRGITFTSASILIYCLVELFYINKCG